MNFARAWLSRLIRLAKTGLGIAPVPMKDRLQAARETNARLEATIHPKARLSPPQTGTPASS
jgi:hypothetical protein